MKRFHNNENDFQKKEKKIKKFHFIGIGYFKWIIKYNLLTNIVVYINNFMILFPEKILLNTPISRRHFIGEKKCRT